MQRIQDILTKYELMAKNNAGITFINSLLDYWKDKDKYDSDLAAGKKIRRSAPVKPNLDDFNKPEESYFALQEIELMGMNFTPLFSKYEQLRALKSNCDLGIIYKYIEHEETYEGLTVMAFPVKIEKKVSKAGNDYYRLYLVDEYSKISVFVSEKTYKDYKDYIKLNEASLLLIDIKKGFQSLKYIKPCNLCDDIKIFNIHFNTNDVFLERKILHILKDNVGSGIEVLFGNKSCIFHVNLTYKIMKELKQNNIEFEFNHVKEEIPYLICGCETEEEYNEVKEIFENENKF